MRATSTEDTPLHRHSSDDSTRTLIDDYLAEQQRLQTPVRRFSDAHDQQTRAIAETVWRDLIPLSAPRAGEQYAFEVNLDQCTGCKACVAGCHSLNGLEHEETWRDVGLVHGGTRSHPFQQTVTSACHHCEDPACLNGCPVLAYEKDPITGIVRHLDDQCIGCQYCVLKCPYDVPKYSERLGIVRKCDMCHNRLAVGEAPACVQACPTQAIRIVTVKTGVEAAALETTEPEYFPPVETSHDYTHPTTRYITSRKMPENVAAADAVALRSQPPHWPLVIMLTLMPMAVGGFTLDALRPEKSPGLATAALIAGALGLAGSVFHLGQPLRAWRVFLGLRRSWLSREAVIFGGWFGLAAASTLLRWIPARMVPALLAHVATPLAWAVATVGCVGLFCSVMIYADTRRPFWRFAQTAPRFFGTAAVLGGATAFALYSDVSYAMIFGIATLFKIAVETRCLRALDQDDEAPTPARQTARLLSESLRGATAVRYVTALALVTLSAVVLTTLPSPAARWALVALALLSEGAERYLFFRAVYAPKMPGVVSL